MNTDKIIFGAYDKNRIGLSVIPTEKVSVEKLNADNAGSDYEAYECVDISGEEQTIKY